MDLHQQVVAALFGTGGNGKSPLTLRTNSPFSCANHFERASRFCFAHLLSDGTSFIGGPPSVPQAQGPSILDSVMQEQDLVFRQAHT
jgi:hypothetical protein